MKTIGGLRGFLQAFAEARAEGQSVHLRGSSESFKVLALCSLYAQMRVQAAKSTGPAPKLIVLVPKHKDLLWWHSQLLDNGIEDAAQLPGYSLWGGEHFSNHRQLQSARLFALASLARSAQPSIVVTTVQGLLCATMPVEEFSAAMVSLQAGADYDFDSLVARLRALGYREAITVEEAGTFAINGGTLDVFAFNLQVPYRLEFFGDTLQSIRAFSLQDQRSYATFDYVEITPGTEVLLRSEDATVNTQALYDELLKQNIDASERMAILEAFSKGRAFAGMELFAPLWRKRQTSALSYLNNNAVFFLPSSLLACQKAYEEFFKEVHQGFLEDSEVGRITLTPDRHYEESFDHALLKIRQFCHIEADRPIGEAASISVAVHSEGVVEKLGEVPKNLSSWLERAKELIAAGHHVVFFAKNTARLALLQEQCADVGIEAGLLKEPYNLVIANLNSKHSVHLSCGSLPDLYWDHEAGIMWIPCEKLYGAVKKKSSASAAKRLHSLLLAQQQLVPGDLVVHLHHGIGRFLGVEHLVFGGNAGDFIKIEYQKGDKVYLPAANINLLQKYQSQDSAAGVSLDSLKSSNWQNRKSRVKKAAKDIAKELLTIQAQRQLAKGYAYTADNELYQQFCEDFPYTPTDDQLRAIAEVEADLASQKVMDRMVIGDVGFGKTEVALRAAFRVISEGMQVLFLAPTTILCFQHYETIKKRFAKYGVACSFVNRYITGNEQKKRIQQFGAGSIDILVGTHRLLSKDVSAKKLGLIVIDEEQKFGVEHKEKLKALRLQADLLVLTATPIPRSLHMALLGLRDISLITTAPPNRLPVKTVVGHTNDALIQKAISAELAREGQVFFVHNRVDDIEQVCAYLQSLVPFAKIASAHGQMQERYLEKVMMDFYEQKLNVLVCTSIIEAGIDMPNVNTLMVNNADHFGLAQLYQLRGRVGRSSVQGYAYLLVRNEARLTVEAKQRLDVLQTYQDLGAGFQIANFDLELRGAGNLLGGEQSGHVAAVGLDYYNQVLQDTLASLAGKDVKEESDCELKIPISAFIPKSYMPRESDRLKTYRQLFAAENPEEIAEIFNGVIDRYGRAPIEMSRLMQIAGLKKVLQAIRAIKLQFIAPGHYTLSFHPLEEKAIAHIMQQVASQPRTFALSSGFALQVYVPAEEEHQLPVLQSSIERLRWN